MNHCRNDFSIWRFKKQKMSHCKIILPHCICISFVLLNIFKKKIRKFHPLIDSGKSIRKLTIFAMVMSVSAKSFSLWQTVTNQAYFPLNKYIIYIERKGFLVVLIFPVLNFVNLVTPNSKINEIKFLRKRVNWGEFREN